VFPSVSVALQRSNAFRDRESEGYEFEWSSRWRVVARPHDAVAGLNLDSVLQPIRLLTIAVPIDIAVIGSNAAHRARATEQAEGTSVAMLGVVALDLLFLITTPGEPRSMRKLAMASSAGGSARTEICNHAEGTTFYARLIGVPSTKRRVSDSSAFLFVFLFTSTSLLFRTFGLIFLVRSLQMLKRMLNRQTPKTRRNFLFHL